MRIADTRVLLRIEDSLCFFDPDGDLEEIPTSGLIASLHVLPLMDLKNEP